MEKSKKEERLKELREAIQVAIGKAYLLDASQEDEFRLHLKAVGVLTLLRDAIDKMLPLKEMTAEERMRADEIFEFGKVLLEATRESLGLVLEAEQ